MVRFRLAHPRHRRSQLLAAGRGPFLSDRYKLLQLEAALPSTLISCASILSVTATAGCRVEHAYPGVSRDMIRLVLRRIQKQGQAECLGRGPGAPWRKRGNTSKKG